MTLWLWAISAAVTVQSLGEVAEREKERRERNAEAGVAVISFTGTGSGDVVEVPSEAETEEPTPGLELAEDDGDKSPLEVERERGEAFEPRIAEIARAADRVDRLYQRYMDRCYNRYAIGATPPGIGVPVAPSSPVNVEVGRNWFIVLDTPSATSTAVPRAGGGNIILVQTVECQELWADVYDAAMAVKQSMRELLADARREGILPGVIRDLRRKYRLEWSGWER